MKISVFTLGCKTNFYESQQIVAALKQLGHDASEGLEKADIFVLNTCAITAEAERKSRQAVARARKLNPDCRIVVMGCASQNNATQFENLDNVTFIKGTAGKTDVADILENAGVDICPPSDRYSETLFADGQRTRSFIKIQDGCNNFCSYCIVPYLRGRSRSRKIEDIVNEVRQATSEEVVLIGIDITQFGRDNGTSLAQLFDALPDDKRYRLGSLEESALTEDVLESLKRKNFCAHFHLSLQSGSDSVLKRMNRHYTAQQFADGVRLIRGYFPDAAFTTDVIVGFCGETEEEFEQTCRFVEQIGFADIHVFPYSARKGTVASRWEDTPAEVKHMRAERLGEIKRKLKSDFLNSQIGKTEEVLAERSRNGMWEGYSRNYTRVYFKGNATEGQTVKVIAKELYKDGVKGDLL